MDMTKLMEQRTTKNLKPLIYKIFLVLLIVGMHGEYQFSRFTFLGNEIQYSSVEFFIGFSILFLCGYVLYTRTDLKEIFKEKTLLWLLSFFCLSLILSTIFARYRVEAIKYDIRIMATMVLFYLLLQFLSKERLKEFALIVFNVVGMAVCLVCLLKYFDVEWVNQVFGSWGKGSRTMYSASVFQHNNVFGNWLVLLIFITLGQLKEINNKTCRIWLGISIGLFAITLPLTTSRSAWVALLAAGGLYLWIKRKHSASLKTAAIVLSVFLIGLIAMPQVRSRLIQTKNQLLSFNSYLARPADRPDLCRDSLKMFKSQPLFGVGLNNFKNVFYEFGECPKRFHGVFNAHNQYLNILAEQGAFGFIVFMAFVGYLVALGIGNIRRGGNEFFALAIFAYLIGELFDYLWYDYSFIFMFWFVVILNILEKRSADYADYAEIKAQDNISTDPPATARHERAGCSD